MVFSEIPPPICSDAPRGSAEFPTPHSCHAPLRNVLPLRKRGDALRTSGEEACFGEACVTGEPLSRSVDHARGSSRGFSGSAFAGTSRGSARAGSLNGEPCEATPLSDRHLEDDTGAAFGTATWPPMAGGSESTDEILCSFLTPILRQNKIRNAVKSG